MQSLSDRVATARKPFFLHLLLSLATATIVAALVFFIWYPWPFDEMLGGAELFWLVVSVDVICGPLLTLVLWNPTKSPRELLSDMSMIVTLQTAALAYGVYTVAIVRPIHIIFEVDRFRVISASEVDSTELHQAIKDVLPAPWTGPTLLSLREPRDNDELIKSIELSTSGQEPSLRPDWWQPYEKKRSEILTRAKSLKLLYRTRPSHKDTLDRAVLETGMSEESLLWLPLTSSRSLDWVVLIDREKALPRGYAKIDGFITVE